MNKFNVWHYLCAKEERGQPALGDPPDWPGAPAEAGFGLCIHLSLIVKQCLGDVDLVFLGGKVKGLVVILGHSVWRCALVQMSSSSMTKV